MRPTPVSTRRTVEHHPIWAHCSAAAQVSTPSPSTYSRTRALQDFLPGQTTPASDSHTHAVSEMITGRSVCSSSRRGRPQRRKAGSTHEEKLEAFISKADQFQEFICQYFKDADDRIPQICLDLVVKRQLSWLSCFKMNSHVGGLGSCAAHFGTKLHFMQTEGQLLLKHENTCNTVPTSSRVWLPTSKMTWMFPQRHENYDMEPLDWPFVFMVYTVRWSQVRFRKTSWFR